MIRAVVCRRGWMQVVILGVLLSACGTQGTTGTLPGGAAFRGMDSGIVHEFARVIEPSTFTFPKDHGPHTEYQSEWWYYTGNLVSEEGERFSYQFTIFRRGLTNVSVQRDSNFATDQVYFAHFAIAAVEQEDHRFYERFSRGSLGLAGASNQPYEVFLEDWRIRALDEEGERVNLSAEEGDIALDLELEAMKPIVIHGEGGVSAKSSEVGNASYYLSFTRMKTLGSMRFGERSFRVEGISWFDHEWSTSALGEGVVGWDWFSLQLSDQRELMLYILRRDDGTVESVSAGTLVEAKGESRQLGLDDFEIQALAQWESPESGAVYPSGWRIVVPTESLELEILPTFKDQEMRVSFVYWEGSVNVQGSSQGEPITGQGFVELTGYFESLSGQF